MAGTLMDRIVSHGYQKISYVRSASIGRLLWIPLFSHLDKLVEVGTPQDPWTAAAQDVWRNSWKWTP